MIKKYGLWWSNPKTLVEGGWVMEGDKVDLYPSKSAAEKSMKENFVCKDYVVKEYRRERKK